MDFRGLVATMFEGLFSPLNFLVMKAWETDFYVYPVNEFPCWLTLSVGYRGASM